MHFVCIEKSFAAHHDLSNDLHQDAEAQRQRRLLCIWMQFTKADGHRSRGSLGGRCRWPIRAYFREDCWGNTCSRFHWFLRRRDRNYGWIGAWPWRRPSCFSLSFCKNPVAPDKWSSSCHYLLVVLSNHHYQFSIGCRHLATFWHPCLSAASLVAQRYS